jgi:hypothetical protein
MKAWLLVMVSLILTIAVAVLIVEFFKDKE